MVNQGGEVDIASNPWGWKGGTTPPPIAKFHNMSSVNFLVHRRNSHLLNVAYIRKLNPKYIKTANRQTRLFEGPVLKRSITKNRAADHSVYNKCASAWNAKPIDKVLSGSVCVSVIIQTGRLSITWVRVCPSSYRQEDLVLPGSVCVRYHTDRKT